MFFSGRKWLTTFFFYFINSHNKHYSAFNENLLSYLAMRCIGKKIKIKIHWLAHGNWGQHRSHLTIVNDFIGIIDVRISINYVHAYPFSSIINATQIDRNSIFYCINIYYMFSIRVREMKCISFITVNRDIGREVDCRPVAGWK